jgi:hypothetical protein
MADTQHDAAEHRSGKRPRDRWDYQDENGDKIREQTAIAETGERVVVSELNITRLLENVGRRVSANAETVAYSQVFGAGKIEPASDTVAERAATIADGLRGRDDPDE